MVEANLASLVHVNPQFQKSIRIDLDLSNQGALDSYFVQTSGVDILQRMGHDIKESRNCAFTWTGPFGSGKSSLALLLSALVSKNRPLKNKACELLSPYEHDFIDEVFLNGKRKWTSLNLVGSYRSLRETLRQRVEEEFGAPCEVESVVETLLKHCNARSGVLLIIDELGKFLQNSIKDHDVIFLQELAEAANRSQGAFIVVGILHQSFEAYIGAFSKTVRDEWSKVQGRFENLYLMPTLYETLYLIGHSLVRSDKYQVRDFDFEKLDGFSHGQYRLFKQGAGVLTLCFPLHPVSAMLLCAFANKSYGQNERSVFSFLSSNAAGSFTNFLTNEAADSTRLYMPYDFYDYVDINQLISVTGSRDIHLWQQMADTLMRVGARCNELEIRLLKSVAVLEIFGKSFGIVANLETLALCVLDTEDNVEQALSHICELKALLYRKFDSKYSIFVGSDFDFDEEYAREYAKTVPDFSTIESYFKDKSRIVAKRHYARTGSLRWFDLLAVSEERFEAVASQVESKNDCAGAFVIVYLSESSDRKDVIDRILALNKPQVVVGLNERSEEIIDLGRALTALNAMLKNPKLEGDPVARREISERQVAVHQRIENEIAFALEQVTFYYQGQVLSSDMSKDFSSLASDIADNIFSKGLILHNELINRNRPSANVNAAKRKLFIAMVENHAVANLGFVKAPAEMCIYSALLKTTGMHHVTADGSWIISIDDSKVSKDFREFYADTLRFIEDSCAADPNGKVKAQAIYDFWSLPPYGIKNGVQPLLLLTLILSNQKRIAVYQDELFCVEFDTDFIDHFNIASQETVFKYYGKQEQDQILANVIQATQCIDPTVGDHAEPLEVGRALVRFVLRLPALTQNTATLTKRVSKLRAYVTNADDPIDLIYHKLPDVYSDLSQNSSSLAKDLQTLRAFYSKQLGAIKDLLFKGLAVKKGDSLAQLKQRAVNIARMSGDTRIEQLIAQIASLNPDAQDQQQELLKLEEGLLSTFGERPKHMFNDQVVNRVLTILPQVCLDFRKTESYVSLRDRGANRSVVSITFGAGESQDITEVVELSSAERSEAKEKASEMMQTIAGLDQHMAYAVLAELGVLLGQRK